MRHLSGKDTRKRTTEQIHSFCIYSTSGLPLLLQLLMLLPALLCMQLLTRMRDLLPRDVGDPRGNLGNRN